MSDTDPVKASLLDAEAHLSCALAALTSVPLTEAARADITAEQEILLELAEARGSRN